MKSETTLTRFRLEERREINLPTTARIPHADAQITVLNLSATGCKLRTATEAARLGCTVLVRLSAEDEVSGQIVWRQGEICGVHFHRQIPAEMICRLTGTFY
ncbi:PilZ domain-containing protein [Aurantiacibacter hainanensis]|uniref:PilZ domain-containing protein n=1 Tax=Aurantiacibacter hainanensis TaxID=3076114 RepID=UPI0030C6B7DA